MTVQYTEFENENGFRNYPFAESCTLVGEKGFQLDRKYIVDASVYPTNPVGSVYLSRIDSKSGIFEISDDTGVIASGVRNGTRVDLFLMKSPNEHAGVLILGSQSNSFERIGFDVSFTKEATLFCSTAVSPIKPNGVTRISFENKYSMISFGTFTSKNTSVRPMVYEENGKTCLKMDVIPETVIRSNNRAIKKVYVVISNGSWFRGAQLPDGRILITLAGISREDVCNQTHKGSPIVIDLCKSEEVPKCEQKERGQIGTTEFETGSMYESMNSFILTTEDIPDYNNPLHIGLVEGTSFSNPPKIDNVLLDNTKEVRKLLEKNTSGNGISISIPGVGSMHNV